MWRLASAGGRRVAQEDGSQRQAPGCPSSLGRGEGAAAWPRSQGRGGCPAWVWPAFCSLSPARPPSRPPGNIPRCLAGQPCPQHPSGGGARPAPRSPGASCLERGPGTPEEDGARGPQRASAWHGCVGRGGSVRSSRPGTRLWAATEPTPRRVGSGDVLIAPQCLVRPTAAIPARAVCETESQGRVTPQTGVQAEASRATLSSR